MITFGQFISSRRKAQRLTQSEAARLLLVASRELNDIENDRRDPREGDLVLRLAALFELDLQELKAMADAHFEHRQARTQMEDDEYTSLVAFRLSRDV